MIIVRHHNCEANSHHPNSPHILFYSLVATTAVYSATSSPTAPLIDISPAGWSKGTSVRYIADQLGLALDEVATFGDSENDLSMIEAVPNSVAVSNASPEVAAAARWHIGASADDAVADALFEIANAAKTGEMPAFMRD